MTLATPAAITIARQVRNIYFFQLDEATTLFCSCGKIIGRFRADHLCEGSLELELVCRSRGCKLKNLFTIRVDRSRSATVQ